MVVGFSRIDTIDLTIIGVWCRKVLEDMLILEEGVDARLVVYSCLDFPCEFGR